MNFVETAVEANENGDHKVILVAVPASQIASIRSIAPNVAAMMSKLTETNTSAKSVATPGRRDGAPNFRRVKNHGLKRLNFIRTFPCAYQSTSEKRTIFHVAVNE